MSHLQKSSNTPNDSTSLSTPQNHSWSFFRAGGVIQVDLKTPQDIIHLKDLDRKHWMALAIPTIGVNIDPRTMTLLDTDCDGQVRPPEILQAIEWLKDRLHRLDPILSPKETIALEDLKDPGLVTCALRVLQDLGQSDAKEIKIEMVDQAISDLKEAPLNGDGVITPESAPEPPVATLIEKIIVAYGSVTDRSGKPGVSLEVYTKFFAAIEERCGWIRSRPQTILAVDEADLTRSYAAFKSVEKAIDQYFILCQLKSFDGIMFTKIMERVPEGAPLEDALASKPLAQPQPSQILDFSRPLNPLWTEAVKDFSSFHSIATLDINQWQALKAAYQPYELWLSQKPANGLTLWSDQECLELSNGTYQTQILDIINLDLKKAADYENIVGLQKLILFGRDFLKVLQNFVNFSDFYRFRNGIFQAGTLYLDGRSTDLCLEIHNPDRHTTLDIQSGAFLVYCDCTRASAPKRSLLAVMTNGEGSQITAGRAGVFYGRDGLDWTAVITKVVANPVSYREAFFSPYRRIARWIEEQIQKRMAASDVTSATELAKVTTILPSPAPTASAAAPKKFDVGTIAAMGVALGSLGTFFGMVISRFFDLGLLMPFGIGGLCLMISLPSVVLAWFKLKNRNLAPILDANGWAINTRAIINVPFAASLTSLRQVPITFGTVLPDPYAEKSRPWKFYWAIGGLAFILALWISGYLDRFLPISARFSRVIHQESAVAPPVK